MTRSIAILVETGAAQLRGNAFSATWGHQATKIELWRLYRQDGRLSRDDSFEPPAGYQSFYGGLTLRQIPAEAVARAESILDCAAALTRCAIRRTPEPCVVRDQTGNRDRGLKLIDPATGVAVRGAGSNLVVVRWTRKNPAAVRRAATLAMRDNVRRVSMSRYSNSSNH